MKMIESKAVYAAPSTRLVLVEMEGSVCAGSVDVGGNTDNKDHDVNTDFNGGFESDEWD